MKHALRSISMLLALTLLLTACGNTLPLPTPSSSGADPTPGVSSTPEPSGTPAVTSTPDSTPAPTPTPVPTPAPTPTPAPGSATVTNVPQTVNPGQTFTGSPVLDPIQYSVPDPSNQAGLSTERHDFSYGAAKNGQPHSITVGNQQLFDSLSSGALAWDNKSSQEEKVLYLTFDCGYEYGTLTSDMLDTLKEKGVPATFFCTLDYLEDAPQVVARMIAEGHIVGNHSTTHPSNCAALTREELAWELLGFHNYMRVNFGYDTEYFRFPAGVYSECALDLVDDMGYKSVFWSIAHADWDPNNQPGVDVSFNTVTGRLHPGAVILLHSTSPDNEVILGDFIDYARQQGYTFKSLDEYPWP